MEENGKTTGQEQMAMLKESPYGQHSSEKKKLLSKKMVFFFLQSYFCLIPVKTVKCLASITQALLLAPLCSPLSFSVPRWSAAWSKWCWGH